MKHHHASRRPIGDPKERKSRWVDAEGVHDASSGSVEWFSVLVWQPRRPSLVKECNGLEYSRHRETVTAITSAETREACGPRCESNRREQSYRYQHDRGLLRGHGQGKGASRTTRNPQTAPQIDTFISVNRPSASSAPPNASPPKALMLLF